MGKVQPVLRFLNSRQKRRKSSTGNHRVPTSGEEMVPLPSVPAFRPPHFHAFARLDKKDGESPACPQISEFTAEAAQKFYGKSSCSHIRRRNGATPVCPRISSPAFPRICSSRQKGWGKSSLSSDF